MAYGYIPSPFGVRKSSIEKEAKRDKKKDDAVREARKTPPSRASSDRLPDGESKDVKTNRKESKDKALEQYFKEGVNPLNGMKTPEHRGRDTQRIIEGEGRYYQGKESIDKSEDNPDEELDAMHTPMGRARADGSNRYPRDQFDMISDLPRSKKKPTREQDALTAEVIGARRDPFGRVLNNDSSYLKEKLKSTPRSKYGKVMDEHVDESRMADSRNVGHPSMKKSEDESFDKDVERDGDKDYAVHGARKTPMSRANTIDDINFKNYVNETGKEEPYSSYEEELQNRRSAGPRGESFDKAKSQKEYVGEYKDHEYDEYAIMGARKTPQSRAELIDTINNSNHEEMLANGRARSPVNPEYLHKSESPNGTVKPALPRSDFDVYNPDSYPEDEFSEQDQQMIDIIARDEPESLEDFKQSIRDQNKKVRDHDYYVMHTPDHPDFADTRKKYEDKYLDYLQRDKSKPFGKSEDESIDKANLNEELKHPHPGKSLNPGKPKEKPWKRRTEEEWEAYYKEHPEVFDGEDFDVYDGDDFEDGSIDKSEDNPYRAMRTPKGRDIAVTLADTSGRARKPRMVTLADEVERMEASDGREKSRDVKRDVNKESAIREARKTPFSRANADRANTDYGEGRPYYKSESAPIHKSIQTPIRDLIKERRYWK